MSAAILRACAPLLLSILGLIAPAAAQERPVLVFAAASLRTALDAAGEAWRRETGRRAAFSYAGSPALARQIEQGAPADVFASADLEWMDHVERRGLIREKTRRNLLGNGLVLIAPRDAPHDIKLAPGAALAAALGDSRLAMGDPQSVPAGRYARAALVQLGLWDEVRSKVAGTENVRAALALVARGEARLGIVYETDARTEPRVRIVDRFPGSSHPPVVYPFAVTAASTNPDAAAFIAFLASPAAERIFRAEGFDVLR